MAATASFSGSVQGAVLPGLGGCTGEDVNWLSENRTTLELAPGRSKQITVTADARVLTAPGAYAADLNMITDAPYVPQPVRVGLKANAPASWAEITGTVTDAATGRTLAGATVSLSGRGESPVTVTTDRHGVYRVWSEAGRRRITVTDEGYAKRSKAVSARSGRTATVDSHCRRTDAVARWFAIHVGCLRRSVRRGHPTRVPWGPAHMSMIHARIH
jgi:hypothetical protein